MSAPDTKLDKQKRRHRPALIGMAVVVLFGALMALLFTGAGVDDDNDETIVDQAADAVVEQPRSDEGTSQ